MFGISLEVWGAVGTIAAAGATVGTPIVGWAVSAMRAKHAAELSALRQEFKADVQVERATTAAAIKDVANVTANAQKQEDLSMASLKAAWVVIDDLRINGVRKQDQERLRDEFRSDMKVLGDRVEAAITALRDDIHREKRE